MDITQIVKSKTRKAVLELYFAHPERRYYLRELERILHFPVQNIRRELIALEKGGIFRKEKNGKQLYYFLNTDSPIFEELKKIISKTIGIEGQLRSALLRIEGVREAFIFGSFAQDRVDALSDVDLMIIGDADEDVLLEKISRLEEKNDREINYHIFSETEIAKRKKKNDPFVVNILSKKTIPLVKKDE